MDERELDTLIEHLVEESEATRHEDMPADAKPVRRSRGIVMSVRLNEREYAALLEAARRRELPASTLMRSLVQRYLREPVTVEDGRPAVNVEPPGLGQFIPFKARSDALAKQRAAI
mgnify:CR=1 FL=1